MQKENEPHLDGRGERAGEWGGSISSSSDSEVCESVVSDCSGVRGGAQAENGFIVF